MFIPKNELGVVFIFGHLYTKLGFDSIKEIHSKFPDCIAYRYGKEVRIEFEYKSSNFLEHKHNPEECDLVVCWRKDVDLTVEVIDLEEPYELIYAERVMCDQLYPKPSSTPFLDKERMIQRLIHPLYGYATPKIWMSVVKMEGRRNYFYLLKKELELEGRIRKLTREEMNSLTKNQKKRLEIGERKGPCVVYEPVFQKPLK